MELISSKATNNVELVMKARDTAVLDAVKAFLVANGTHLIFTNLITCSLNYSIALGHMPQGTANMLLMSTLPDTLKSLASSKSVAIESAEMDKKVKEMSSYVKVLMRLSVLI